MNRFKSALRTAAMYTLAYFFIFTGAFWLTFFVLVTFQAFWKIFASFFVIALAICTFDAFGGVDRVRKIWRKSPIRKPSIIEGKLVMS